MKTIKTISRFKRPLVILFSALSLLAACKKDHDSHPAPVTNPISVAAAKAGDTIRIQGTNFSEDVNQVKVSFNGTAATVVSASATEIVVVVPQGAASGNVTVTVYGNTVQAGTLTINPLTLYALKKTENSGSASINELVAIDPVTATVSTIQNLDNLPDNFSINYLVYLPATNELVGLDDDGLRLTKINVATKQRAIISLSSDVNNYFSELVSDKAGNLYSIKRKVIDPRFNYTENTLTKIDPATGTTTSLQLVEYDFTSLSYIPATNNLIGIIYGHTLKKLNLTTKDTSSVEIASSGNYKRLVVDDKSNLYSYKTTTSLPYTGSLGKLDAVTGKETLLTNLNTGDPLWDKLIFIPQLNEIFSRWKEASLFRFNVGNNKQTITEISSTPNVYFYDLTSN